MGLWSSSPTNPDQVAQAQKNPVQEHPTQTNPNQAAQAQKNLVQERPTQEQVIRVETLRQRVKQQFSGQKFLVVGQDGSGKSSLINSINHVMRLENPDAVHQEVAEVANLSSKTKTCLLHKFDSSRHVLQDVDVPDHMKPVFFDVCGMSENEKARVGEIILLLANGKIKEGTDLRPLLESQFDLEKLSTCTSEDMKCWSIIYVTSIAHDTTPKLAIAVGDVWEKLQTDGWDIRIFCIMTHSDKLKNDPEVDQRRQTRRANIEERLRIPQRRIWEISNYTDDDLRPDNSTIPNPEKDEKILYALWGMLQPVHIPRPTGAAAKQ